MSAKFRMCHTWQPLLEMTTVKLPVTVCSVMAQVMAVWVELAPNGAKLAAG